MTLKTTNSTASPAPVAAGQPQEKILFEVHPEMLPVILTVENLALVGITLVIVIAFVAFHFGLTELLVIAALYLLLALPSFITIFRVGSTTYVLTNRRLAIFSAGIRNQERSVALDQVTGTKVKQSGLQRLTGAGEIIIYLKGLRKPMRLPGLKNCKRRAEQIDQALKKVQNKA